jgi:hypothetical protein
LVKTKPVSLAVINYQKRKTFLFLSIEKEKRRRRNIIAATFQEALPLQKFVLSSFASFSLFQNTNN